MSNSKIENLGVYSKKHPSARPKWGQQWDNEVLEYLSKIGPLLLFNRMLKEKAEEPCLILGFSYEQEILSSFYRKIVGINLTKGEFQLKDRGNKDYELIVCNAENLPFKDSTFKNVISHAFLHHVDVQNQVFEIKRVSCNNGFFYLWEPGKYNLIAAVGRKFFPTNIHVKSEHPFNPSALKRIIINDLGKIQYEGYYHIVSAILPFFAKYNKFFKSKKIADFADKIDRILAHTILKNFAWVLIFGVEIHKNLE